MPAATTHQHLAEALEQLQELALQLAQAQEREQEVRGPDGRAAPSCWALLGLGMLQGSPGL